VEALLRDDEWTQWSDRKIAWHCGVSNRFVGDVRRELASVDGSQMVLHDETDEADEADGTRTTTECKFQRRGKTHVMRTGNIGQHKKKGASETAPAATNATEATSTSVVEATQAPASEEACVATPVTLADQRFQKLANALQKLASETLLCQSEKALEGIVDRLTRLGAWVKEGRWDAF
jgi:hypothetical protein